MCTQELRWFFRTIASDALLSIPLFAYLAANVAGALHSPVLQFFYESIGAAPDQIGNIAIARSLSVLVLSPIYGKLVDQGFTVEVMLASWAFCSAGCFVRGLATSVDQLYLSSMFMGFSGSLDGLMLAHFSLHFPSTSEKRGLIVSSFSAISTATLLLGRLGFPLAMDVLEGVIVGTEDGQKVRRFRVLVTVCTVGCMVGLASLVYVFCKRGCSKGKGRSESGGEEEGSGREEMIQVRMPVAWEVVLALSLVVMTMTITLVNTFWPLYLEDTFGWDSKSYGYAVIVLSVARIGCLAMLPMVEKRVQLSNIMQATMLSSALLGLLAFAVVKPTVHVMCVVGAYSLLSMADSSLKAEFTRSMSQSVQGRAWGGLSALVELGKIVGAATIHLVSTNYSLPFTVVFMSVLFCSIPLAVANQYCHQPTYLPIDQTQEVSSVELT